MLEEAKLALRVTATKYDPDIMDLLAAGAKDLEIAGVRLHGRVNYTKDQGGVHDHSTIKDPLEKRAILTYAAMRFGNPPNYDKLKEAYDEQKVQLMHATGYTDYKDGGDLEC